MKQSNVPRDVPRINSILIYHNDRSILNGTEYIIIKRGAKKCILESVKPSFLLSPSFDINTNDLIEALKNNIYTIK